MIAFFEDSDFYYKLEELFEQHGLPARGWRDYRDLVENLRTTHPGVVLLDVEIDDEREAGLEALRVIKERFPRIKAIMLTGHPEYVLRAFRAGADGYLLKEEVPASIEYLREVIADVSSGKVVMSDEVRRIIAASLLPYEKVELNTRERQIVALAAGDKSGPQIAEALGLRAQTVETYLKNIKLKLNCHTIQGVVAKALRNNLIEWQEFVS